jgi:hypothetical protein
LENLGDILSEFLHQPPLSSCISTLPWRLWQNLVAINGLQNIQKGKVRQNFKSNNEEVLKEIIVSFIYHIGMRILREKLCGK